MFNLFKKKPRPFTVEELKAMGIPVKEIPYKEIPRIEIPRTEIPLKEIPRKGYNK